MLLQNAHVEACLALLGPGLRTTPRVRRAIPAIWRHLLAAGQLTGTVVTDRSPDATGRVVAFGMTTFVDRAFAAEYLTAPWPYLSAFLYDSVLNRQSPVLDAKGVRAANTAGTLNLLILHYGMQQLSDPPTERDLAIVDAAHRGFQAAHAGYRAERVIQEAYGSAEAAFMEAGGFRLADTFDRYYADRGMTSPPPSLRPYLMLADRHDPARRLPGTTISVVFRHAVPRFSFTAAERRLLQWTLLDEHDDTVAHALGVSPDAIKKVWRRIYERVSAVDHAIVEDDGDGAGADWPSGSRKRQRLLRYLKSHPEELRPFSAP